MAKKRKDQEQVNIVLHDCFDDEIMGLQISLKDKVKLIKEIIHARDKDKLISQQVLLHNDKLLEPNTAALALLPKGWKKTTSLPTVHLQLLISSMILQSASSQAEFRSNYSMPDFEPVLDCHHH